MFFLVPLVFSGKEANCTKVSSVFPLKPPSKEQLFFMMQNLHGAIFHEVFFSEICRLGRYLLEIIYIIMKSLFLKEMQVYIVFLTLVFFFCWDSFYILYFQLHHSLQKKIPKIFFLANRGCLVFFSQSPLNFSSNSQPFRKRLGRFYWLRNPFWTTFFVCKYLELYQSKHEFLLSSIYVCVDCWRGLYSNSIYKVITLMVLSD